MDPHRHNRQDPQMFSPFMNGSNNNAAHDPEPTSPMLSNGQAPQSPNTQLTMNLLNNLLQMQGLENSLIQQQASSAMHSASASGTTSQSSTTPTNPAASPNSFPPHLMLEQQIKLTQLQQLQQLQNQIFQQQIALISGQSPSIHTSSPIFDVNRQSGSACGTPNENQMFTGLPTPGPSGEIRPQQPQDFVSPSALVNYLEPLPHAHVPPSPNTSSRDHQSHNQNSGHSSNGNHHHQSLHNRQGSASGSRNLDIQRQLMALSQTANTQTPQGQHHSYSQHPSSPAAFQHQQQQHNTTSPMMHSTNHMVSPNPFGSNQQQQQHGFNTHNQHSSNMQNHLHGSHIGMPHSAPAHVAFNIYHGEGGMPNTNIPGLTLGPAGTPIDSVGQQRPQRLSMSESPRYGAQNQHQHAMHPMSALDQDISPLTSPWLGPYAASSSGAASSSSNHATRHRNSASMSNSSTTAGAAGNKRMASSSGDEGGSARKKQSPAIRPTLGMSIARLVTRESGSTSPLGQGGKSSSAIGNTPPPLSSSRSASGSVSPDPSRRAPASATSSKPSSSLANVTGAATTTAAGNEAEEGGSGKRSRSTTEGSRKPYRGSKSTNSTPLLKSTPTTATRSSSRSQAARGGNGSGSGTGTYISPMMAGAGQGGEGVHDSPSPVDLNVEGDGGGGVDRSMPPPPLPASVTGTQGSSANVGSSSKSTSGNTNPDSNREGRDERGRDAGEGVDMGEGELRMDVDILGNMMGMGGMGMGGINFGGMGMGEMESMMGMDGMNMEMDMSGMGMDGMGMGTFNTGMEMMDMGGMDFGQHGRSQQGQRQGQQDAMAPPQTNSAMHSGQQQHQQGEQPLVPVTPASIMNLGRLGINSSASNGRLGSATASAAAAAASSSTSASNGNSAVASGSKAVSASASATPGKKTTMRKDSGAAARGAPPGSSVITTRSGRASARKVAPIGASPSLKPILPAGGMTPNMDPTLPSPRILPSAPNTHHTGPTMPGGTPGQPIHVRKTSHKAAEQKRRDSLKTTFDDLRKLLPPIALSNDADVDPSMITSPLFHPTAPLLPGALPPRGPPKAGGEGPNKGVSKLQLLICGNEYIRLLKGRVERRDDEISKLRKELGRLRIVVEEKGGDSGLAAVREEGEESGEGEEREVLDLEKDLDAVEKNFMGGSGAGGRGQEVNDGAGGDDVMEEGDDEDE